MSNCLYTKSLATIDYSIGVLRGYKLVQVPSGWCIPFHMAGRSQSIYLTDHRGRIKKFKSLDAAVRLLRSAGFSVKILAEQ